MPRKVPQLSKPPRKTGPREKLVASGSDMNKFTVIADTAEQKVKSFIKTDYCNGTTSKSLIWGDYSLEGLEDKFIVERKGAVTEFYSNICGADWERFEKELIALQYYPDAYIICEFSMNDVIKFPYNTRMPLSAKKKIRKGYFLRRLMEVMTTYKIPIIFASSEENARTIMISLFKRIWAKYSP
jgi:ERCC4-type nuclease